MDAATIVVACVAVLVLGLLAWQALSGALAPPAAARRAAPSRPHLQPLRARAPRRPATRPWPHPRRAA